MEKPRVTFYPTPYQTPMGIRLLDNVVVDLRGVDFVYPIHGFNIRDHGCTFDTVSMSPRPRGGLRLYAADRYWHKDSRRYFNIEVAEDLLVTFTVHEYGEITHQEVLNEYRKRVYG